MGGSCGVFLRRETGTANAVLISGRIRLCMRLMSPVSCALILRALLNSVENGAGCMLFAFGGFKRLSFWTN